MKSIVKNMRLFYVLLVIALSFICYIPLVANFSSYSLGADSEIVVAAAISLKDAFQEIGRLYETRNETKVNFNFGASGILQKQIEGGAPVDVFASAGEKQMDELEGKGLISQETRGDFTRNALVLVVPIDSQLNINSFDALNSFRVKRIAIGNPKQFLPGNTLSSCSQI